MAKTLAWTCLVLGLLIIAMSILKAILLLNDSSRSVGAMAALVGFRAFAVALGVALVVFGRRKLQWIREEAAYDKAVGGRPRDDFADFEEHGIDDDPRA
ncbi:MAG: hypothetical protein GXY74_15325 [Phycisphaerae bacterium]|nr:hypothetical protein [Phycisphaerae bacterium]